MTGSRDRRVAGACAALVCFAVVATAPAQTPGSAPDSPPPPLEQLEAPTPGSLYGRMGGGHTVEAIVGDLIDRAAREPRTSRSFDKVNLRRLKAVLSIQLCSLAGGGCKYDGDNMLDAHAGLGITEAEFFGLVEELREVMRAHGVGLRERNELLKILAPMKRDVVQR